MAQDIYSINRKHTVNSDFFNVIDNEEKAYWLGFLWADGSISKTAPRCSGPNRLAITQTAINKDSLEAFREIIECSYPLHTVRNNVSKDVLYRLQINSRPLCKSLEALGYGNKDQRVHIPDIPQELIHHFIRGYFDGDGALSVYIQRVQHYRLHRNEWSVTGNEEFLTELRHVLERQAHVTPGRQFKRYKRTDKAVTLRYGKIEDVHKLYDYLYSDAAIYMHRKYEKFQEFLSYYP